MIDEQKIVLIIEDDPSLVFFYEAMLGLSTLRSKFSISVCYSGAKGLERVKKKPEPAIIVLDLHLPEVSGAEIYKVVRQQTKSFVFVVTAHPAMMDQNMRDTADRIFLKPLSNSVEDFIAVTEKYLLMDNEGTP